MSPVKSLIDANCLNLLRKKESPCSTLGRVGRALCGTRSSVRTRGCRVSPALGQGGLLKEEAQELQTPVCGLCRQVGWVVQGSTF